MVHLRQDRPSDSTDPPRQKYIPSLRRNDKNKGVVEIYKHRRGLPSQCGQRLKTLVCAGLNVISLLESRKRHF